jgi:hypothetical protein
MTTFVFKPLWRFLPAALLAAFITASTVAATWIVDSNNGPGTNFTTISAAIAAAQPGDTIIVRAGVYGENVVVNKGVTIVGWNATQYPMATPTGVYPHAIWGTFGITNIPSGERCTVSGLVILRPSPASGVTVGILDSAGTIILDRCVIPNGGVFVNNCTDVFMEYVHVRQFQGALPPQTGVTISNSWVQANDLDATGSDLTTEPDFFPAAGTALEVLNNGIIALARPKLIGGFGGGPWTTFPSSPAGGVAIHASQGGIASIVDDNGSQSYIIGGQGGWRGAASVLSIPSGNGGSAIQADFNGIVTNKKPLTPIGGAPGLNAGGGSVGAFGAPAATFTNGAYQPIVDIPSVYRHVSGSVAGGFFIFNHHAAAPNIPVAIGVLQDISLDIFPPAVQFQGGNPYTAVVLGMGMSNAIGFFDFGFSLPAAPLQNKVGLTVAVQTADNVVNTFFLSNPSTFVLGF